MNIDFDLVNVYNKEISSCTLDCKFYIRTVDKGFI